MIVFLSIALFAMIAAGVYLALSKDLLRIVIGISVIGYATNLLLFASGRPSPTMSAPLLAEGETVLEAAASNPIPQALVLTAIVISFALTCFSLIVVLAIQQMRGTDDADSLREAEPAPGPDGFPLKPREED